MVMADITRQNKLECFLYLLMRDELPCGVVARIVQEIEKSGKQHFVFSNSHLANYALELASRLQISESPKDLEVGKVDCAK